MAQMKLNSILSAAACVLAIAPAAHATYVFTTVDVPGSKSFNQIFGINDSGEVGISSDAGPVLYHGGVYSPLPTIAGYNVALAGINNAGTVVGGAFDTSGAEHGFTLSGGTYSLFDVPGATKTEARAISSTGLVVGYYTDAATGNRPGFSYDPSTGAFTTINTPGSTVSITSGVNAAGQIVGSGGDNTGSKFGFLYQGGSYTTFTVANSITAARAINDTGLIAGWINQIGIGHEGFVGDSSGYQLLTVPGALDTFAQGINDMGQVSGFYFDTLGISHGFIADPAVLPVGTTAGGAYTFSVSVVPNVPIFIDPRVAVGYQYQIGLGDPDFASVMLPIGIGDSFYSLSLCDGSSLGTIAGGQTFSFGSSGVACFDVRGIEPSAFLDPANPAAFVTELSFVGAGEFTGTMTPISQDVDEPATLALLIGAGLAGTRRLRRTRTS